jgi:hypothetical protein
LFSIAWKLAKEFLENIVDPSVKLLSVVLEGEAREILSSGQNSTIFKLMSFGPMSASQVGTPKEVGIEL